MDHIQVTLKDAGTVVVKTAQIGWLVTGMETVTEVTRQKKNHRYVDITSRKRKEVNEGRERERLGSLLHH